MFHLQLRRFQIPKDFDQKIQAIQEFMLCPESNALTAANKRIANFINKTKNEHLPQTIDKSLLLEPAEQALAAALLKIQEQTKTLLQEKRFTDFMLALTPLKEPIDYFFDKVLINTENKAVKNNRLVLLNQLHQLFIQVADISILQA